MIFINFQSTSPEIISNISNETTSLLNFSEPHSLYPVLTNDKNEMRYGYHEWNNRCLLYNLIIFFNKGYDLTFVSPDFHIQKNWNLVKKSLNIENSDIKILLFPWYFLFEYFLKKEQYTFKDDVNIPLEYSACFLSGGRRIGRQHIMIELSKYKNFVFSNMGYPEKYAPEFEILDYELTGEFYKIYVSKISSGLKSTMVMSNDNCTETFSIRKNQYDSQKLIYFYSDYDKMKQPPQPKNICSEMSLPWYVYNIVPDEFLKSVVSFGCETQTDLACHITEKTVKNIFYKKPFLNFGAMHYNKFLVENGFELYDELFNYDFDNTKSNIKRITEYVVECKRILDIPLSELINLASSKTIQEKLNHNYDVADKLSKKLKINESIKRNRDRYKKMIENKEYDNIILREIF